MPDNKSDPSNDDAGKYTDATFTTTSYTAPYGTTGQPRVKYNPLNCPPGSRPVALNKAGNRVVATKMNPNMNTEFVDYGYCANSGKLVKYNWDRMRWNGYNTSNMRNYIYGNVQGGETNSSQDYPYKGWFSNSCDGDWNRYYSFGCSYVNPKDGSNPRGPGNDINWSDAQKLWEHGNTGKPYHHPLLVFYNGSDYDHGTPADGGKLCTDPWTYLWIRASDDYDGVTNVAYSTANGGFKNWNPATHSFSDYDGKSATVADLSTKSSCEYTRAWSAGVRGTK
jgi:hypothetical protein